MPVLLSAGDFITEAGKIPVVDVRSPGEFSRGHFPGSHNIPLLNDEERASVGTAYKREGREKAVIRGFELAGHKFSGYILNALEAAPRKEIILYCWRGGMRSGIMAWLLGMAGFRVLLLKGGYKTFRKWALETLSARRSLVVVGGKTGCGKTELLRCLAEIGEQVIDLENLASHKGSAFGALGLPPQPKTEHFENMLAMAWHRTNPDLPVWIENESRLIGSVKIPDTVFAQILEAPVADIRLPESERIKRIKAEYAVHPVEQLAENTAKLRKRLGHQRLAEAIACLKERNFEGWIKIVLAYYDKTYGYGLSLRKKESLIPVSLESEDYRINAACVRDTIMHWQQTAALPGKRQ